MCVCYHFKLNKFSSFRWD